MLPADFAYVQKLIKEDAGLTLEAARAYLAEIRLGGLARDMGLADTTALLQDVRRGEEQLRARVVESLLVHETRFFRDENSFELLRKYILPELLARGTGGTLGIWSAACSTGQEPYSLAMVLKETLPASIKTRLLATDISPKTLERAREGVYNSLEINRGLAPELRDKYATPLPTGDWRLSEELRGRVQFQEMNLIKPWGPMLPMDIIFLRNVLIYFDADAKKELLRRARMLLRPGGYLFLGGTETVLMADPNYRLVEKHKAWCYQTPLSAKTEGAPV